eukprot:Rmarinus@m.5038
MEAVQTCPSCKAVYDRGNHKPRAFSCSHVVCTACFCEADSCPLCKMSVWSESDKGRYPVIYLACKNEREPPLISTCAALPEVGGDAVALSYDAYRDVVWVVTSERYVRSFLVGRRNWSIEWFRLEMPPSATSTS